MSRVRSPSAACFVLAWSLCAASGAVFAASGEGAAQAAAEEPPFFGFHGVPEGDSILVLEVYPGTPAERAGLEVDDRIVSFNGAGFHFEDYVQLTEGMKVFRPGDRVVLAVVRDATTTQCELVVAAKPEVFKDQTAAAIAQVVEQREHERRHRAHEAFLLMARGEGVVLTFERDQETDGIVVTGKDVKLPDDLDFESPPAADPVLSAALRMLRPGDRMVLRFVQKPDRLLFVALEMPPYLDLRALVLERAD